jgi:ribosomal protein S18 acetylase RimI-like enzyme
MVDKKNYRVIPFTMKHYEEALSLWKSTNGLGISSADNKENIKRYLKRNHGCSFVAVINNMVIGTILGGHDGRRGYIHHVAVKKEFRKQGIGKELVKKSIEILKKECMKKCHIFVFKKNNKAKKFWQKLKWHIRKELEIMSINF